MTSGARWFRYVALAAVALKLFVIMGVATAVIRGDSIDMDDLVPALSLFVLVSFLHMFLRLGWRRTLLFIAVVFTVCTASESVGVLTGAVFGHYHYSAEVNPDKLFGLVPIGTISYWRFALYGAYIFSLLVWPPDRRAGIRGAVRIILPAAAMVTALDLLIDPVEVARGTWVWEQEGYYFGIPLQNFFGWFLTATVALSLYLTLGRRWPERSRVEHLPLAQHLPIWDVVSEAVVYALIAVGWSLYGPAVIGILAMIPFIVTAIWRLRQQRSAAAGSSSGGS